MAYLTEPPFQHGTPAKIGILLVNLGTPEAPTAPALRHYLKEFLSDPRVVEIPRFIWLPILHGLVLRLVREGKITGLRLDHLDGLFDPLGIATLYAGRWHSPATPDRPLYIVLEDRAKAHRSMPLVGQARELAHQGAPVFRTRAGKVGVAICYDRHFPEYMRALALAGADLVVVPQAGAVGEWPDGLYEAEMRVAAFQNGYFVALCNRVGREDRLDFAGESFVGAPDGSVIARAGQGTEEILYAEVGFAAAENSHARQLFLKHRRPELYGEWLGR